MKLRNIGDICLKDYGSAVPDRDKTKKPGVHIVTPSFHKTTN
jgi:hypothetical protein